MKRRVFNILAVLSLVLLFVALTAGVIGRFWARELPAARPTVTATQTAPEAVDRATLAALDKRLPEVRFDGVGLEAVIDFFRDIGRVNLYLDGAGLQAVGVSLDTPITCHGRELTLEEALTATLESIPQASEPIGFRVIGHAVVISNLDELETMRRVHAADVAQAADPQLSQVLGGVLPEVRFESAGLSDVISFVCDITGASIFVDWESLGLAGIPRNAPVTIRVSGMPLHQVLRLAVHSASDGRATVDIQVDPSNAVIVITAGPQSLP